MFKTDNTVACYNGTKSKFLFRRINLHGMNQVADKSKTRRGDLELVVWSFDSYDASMSISVLLPLNFRAPGSFSRRYNLTLRGLHAYGFQEVSECSNISTGLRDRRTVRILDGVVLDIRVKSQIMQRETTLLTKYDPCLDRPFDLP